MQPETDPDAAWVEELAGAPRPTVERALADAAGARALYRHLEKEHLSEGRESYVEIDAPLELHALVRLGRPRHVVEVGVSSGVSSAYLLDGLERNGRGTLHSIDLPSYPGRTRTSGRPPRASWSLPRGRSPGWAVPFPLRKRWDLRLGDKRDVLPLLARELPRVDLLVYDVPHHDRDIRKELAALDPHLPAGAVVIVDHGPGGEACSALRGWARSHGGRLTGRRGLGLYGARKRRRGRRR
jgi:hypothetical protein